MNKELLDKLKFQAAAQVSPLLEGSEWQRVFTEKFAELIVKECCSKLVEMGESWHEFAKNPPDGQAHNASGALFAAYRLKEDAVDEIKQHFGVTE